MTLSLKFNIRLLHFFGKTKIGYSFYLFAVLYGLFGCSNSENCHDSHIFATFFVLYIISTAIEIWFLVKIPFTRKILDELLTKEYILKYLSEYTASKLVLSFVSSAVGAVILESGTKYVEHQQNLQNSREFLRDYYAGLEHTNQKHNPNSREYKDAINERNFHLRQRSEGLFTKGIKSETTKHIWTEVSKTVSAYNPFGKKE